MTKKYDSSDLLTKSQVGEMLGGVSLFYVNSLLSQKKLPKIRFSYKMVRVPRQAVLDFITNRTIEAKGAK